MHELQLMQQVVRMVENVSQDQDNGKPAIVRLAISSHSHMAAHTSEELQTTFQMAAFGTIAQEARLEVMRIANKGICQVCDEPVERDQDTFTCPTCGMANILWEDQPEVLVQEVDWQAKSI